MQAHTHPQLFGRRRQKVLEFKVIPGKVLYQKQKGWGHGLSVSSDCFQSSVPEKKTF
jgi:hypothetical protein